MDSFNWNGSFEKIKHERRLTLTSSRSEVRIFQLAHSRLQFYILLFPEFHPFSRQARKRPQFLNKTDYKIWNSKISPIPRCALT